MSKIAVVTDSTAYIPYELVKALHISIVPLGLIWEEKTYRDGVDIQPAEVYARLKTAKTLPTTSQPTVGDMQNVFQGLIDQGFEVLGMFISGKLSGTVQSALQAREALGTSAEKVYVLDSNATAMAMGFPVLATARAAEAGAGMKDCLAVANEACQHVGVYFVVETLEFLHRGGRIGGGARFIGSALNLKPILELRDGRIEACERVRTKSKAIDRVMELVGEQVKGKSKIRLSTLNANAEQEAADLLNRASIKFGAIESILTSVSPVVGVHAGPGTVALAYMTDM